MANTEKICGGKKKYFYSATVCLNFNKQDDAYLVIMNLFSLREVLQALDTVTKSSFYQNVSAQKDCCSGSKN